MELFVNLLGVVGLTGLITTGIASAAIGAGMPLLLLAGLVDGPRGGRLAARLEGTGKEPTPRVHTPAHRTAS